MLASLDELRDALPQMQATCSDRFRVLLEMTDVPYHGEALMLTIPLVETCLDVEPNDVGAELLAQLAFFSLLRAVPEQIALQIAFGWRLADEHAHDVAPMLAHDADRGISMNDYLAALDWEADAFDAAGAAWFRGERWQEPDAARVERGIALCRRAAAHVPDGLRSPLLCIAAWLLWAGGKRPHALAYLAEASHDKSSGALVEALRKHMEATVPLWLGDLPRLAPAMPGGAYA